MHFLNFWLPSIFSEISCISNKFISIEFNVQVSKSTRKFVGKMRIGKGSNWLEIILTVVEFIFRIKENCKSYLPYLDRNLSWLEQYSCQINFIRNTWNTKMRNPIENQNIAGRPKMMKNEKESKYGDFYVTKFIFYYLVPPSLFPCLWSAITWCSWAGAEKIQRQKIRKAIFFVKSIEEVSKRVCGFAKALHAKIAWCKVVALHWWTLFLHKTWKSTISFW